MRSFHADLTWAARPSRSTSEEPPGATIAAQLSSSACFDSSFKGELENNDVAVQWLTPKFGVRKEVGEGRVWGNLASVKMDPKLLRETEAQSFIFGQPEVLQSIQTEVS